MNVWQNGQVVSSAMTPGDFNSNNQINPSTVCPTAGWAGTTLWGYDCAGNLVRDGLNATYAYDGENRQVAYCPSQSNPAQCSAAWTAGNTVYTYDGEGRRVQAQQSDGSVTTFVYDAAGQLAAEYGALPVGTQSEAGMEYLTVDHLGSTRMVTNSAGVPVSRQDYLPFGEQMPSSLGERPNVLDNSQKSYSSDGSVRHKFTGKERDAETGLDYFGARYFSAAQGRWTSPDWSTTPQPVPYANLNDPQTLNLYAYVRNNPLAKADADGHCWPLCTVLGGAVGGAVFGGASEYIHQKLTGDGNVNWTKVLHAAEGGAVAGAISGLAGPEAGVAAKIGISAAGSVLGGGVERKLNGDQVLNPTAVAVDAGAGAVGALAEKGLAKVLPNVAAGKTLQTGAGGSFLYTVRDEASAAGENAARNAVRTVANAAVQTAAGAGADVAKDPPTPPPPPPPAPPKPPGGQQ